MHKGNIGPGLHVHGGVCGLVLSSRPGGGRDGPQGAAPSFSVSGAKATSLLGPPNSRRGWTRRARTVTTARRHDNAPHLCPHVDVDAAVGIGGHIPCLAVVRVAAAGRHGGKGRVALAAERQEDVLESGERNAIVCDAHILLCRLEPGEQCREAANLRHGQQHGHLAAHGAARTEQSGRSASAPAGRGGSSELAGSGATYVFLSVADGTSS